MDDEGGLYQQMGIVAGLKNGMEIAKAELGGQVIGKVIGKVISIIKNLRRSGVIRKELNELVPKNPGVVDNTVKAMQKKFGGDVNDKSVYSVIHNKGKVTIVGHGHGGTSIGEFTPKEVMKFLKMNKITDIQKIELMVCQSGLKKLPNGSSLASEMSKLAPNTVITAPRGNVMFKNGQKLVRGEVSPGVLASEGKYLPAGRGFSKFKNGEQVK